MIKVDEIRPSLMNTRTHLSCIVNTMTFYHHHEKYHMIDKNAFKIIYSLRKVKENICNLLVSVYSVLWWVNP